MPRFVPHKISLLLEIEQVTEDLSSRNRPNRFGNLSVDLRHQVLGQKAPFFSPLSSHLIRASQTMRDVVAQNARGIFKRRPMGRVEAVGLELGQPTKGVEVVLKIPLWRIQDNRPLPGEHVPHDALLGLWMEETDVPCGMPRCVEDPPAEPPRLENISLAQEIVYLHRACQQLRRPGVSEYTKPCLLFERHHASHMVVVVMGEHYAGGMHPSFCALLHNGQQSLLLLRPG